jgi:2-polyprenyl-3-methyl-5-hydroxy-6-metoxy-1,4-benzoquinol methylase
MNLRWKVAQTAEQYWWQQYLRKKPVDQYLHQKKAYWHRVLAEAKVSIAPTDRILDAGCGPAGIFMVFPENEVVAIDPLLQRYEQTLAHFRQAWYPWVQFHNTSLENWPARASFDTVFCLNAINHVSDLPLALDRLIASLKPGGTLWLSIDAHRHTWLQPIFQLIPGDILHPHQYSKSEYIQMVEDRQCTIRQVRCLKPGQIFDYYLIEAIKNKQI